MLVFFYSRFKKPKKLAIQHIFFAITLREIHVDNLHT